MSPRSQSATSLLLVLASCIVVVVSQESADKRFAKLEAVSNQLSRQMMLQQLYTEERTRSEGDSGIKQVRFRKDGTKPYHTATFSSAVSMAAIHDHTDHTRTCGMGEIVAVLNGVEFRTRHNDYKLVQPSTTSKNYHAVEEIPFPKVPSRVMQNTDVNAQIEEMRKWFKAWKDQDPSVRDYRDHFKPLLCYLEGAWTNDVNLDEPFDSDRHAIDASSWFDLQEKIRFTSYTGDKSNQENFAYLPTTIMNVTDGIPVFGQWNYRILCHPIQGDVKLSELKPVDNLGIRLANEKTFDAYAQTRSARFSLNPSSEDQFYTWTRLDEIMAQIPGKDNYGANLTDAHFGMTKLNYNDDTPLNTAYYHQWYRAQEKGAMGEKTIHRGFSDKNLFVAQTTQPRVAPMSVYVCVNVRQPNGQRKRECQQTTSRVSYAIPLEIVFLTPLQSWNPFSIKYKDHFKSPEGRTVAANGRNGGRSADKAYNGTNSKTYYHTPIEFFNGKEVGKDTADTTRGSVGVLDGDGKVRAVTASGMRIFLPNIPGVGVLRTRYPIMPVHVEGSPIWKELQALRDVVMDMKKYMEYFQTPPLSPATPSTGGGSTANTGTGTNTETDTPHPVLETSQSSPEPSGLHTHTVRLTRRQYLNLTRRNRRVTVETSRDNGHNHRLMIKYDKTSQTYRIVRCDAQPTCFDGHEPVLNVVTSGV